MLISKIIETGINITDPISLYVSFDENLMEILKDRFVGRCYRECYITQIKRIIKTSECIITSDYDPNYGVLYVIFEVSAIEYHKGEIINGVKVINTGSTPRKDPFICSTNIAGITTIYHKNFESVKVGQLISVRVASVRYDINSTKISITAFPLLHSTSVNTFVVGELTQKDRDDVKQLLQVIVKEEELLGKCDKKSAETFESLLYAYSKDPQVKSKTASIVDIATGKVVLKSGTYISRDPRLKLTTPAVITEDEHTGDVNTTVPYSLSIIYILQDYLSYIRTVREMTEIYNTKELIDSHANLWRIYVKTKY